MRRKKNKEWKEENSEVTQDENEANEKKKTKQRLYKEMITWRQSKC